MKNPTHQHKTSGRANHVRHIYTVIFVVLLAGALGGGAFAVVRKHHTKVNNLSQTHRSPAAQTSTDSSQTKQEQAAAETASGLDCGDTSKTVSGAENVELTLTIRRCYKASVYVSSTGSYRYTKPAGASGYYAQINKSTDQDGKSVGYNSSVSYSYRALDGPQGSNILLLNASVSPNGTLSFNQDNGG